MKVSWLPHFVLMKKVQVVVPWWLQNGVWDSSPFRNEGSYDWQLFDVSACQALLSDLGSTCDEILKDLAHFVLLFARCALGVHAGVGVIS